MKVQGNLLHQKSEIILLTVLVLILHLIGMMSFFITIHFLIVLHLIHSRSYLLTTFSQSRNLSYERKKWLFSVINDILEIEEYSSVFLEYEIAKDLDIERIFDYEIELSIQVETEKFIPNLPDLIHAERELLEIEYRASKLLILLITIPLIFLMFHSIYKTSLILAILRLVILTLIIEFSTVNSRNPYRLTQWGEGLKLLRSNRHNLIHEPFQSLSIFSPYFDNLSSSEISIEPLISKDGEASTKTIALLILILTKIDQFVREPLIDQFLHVTKDLPQYEEVHNIKWKVFSNQFIIISIISTFVSAILSSIVSISAGLSSHYNRDSATEFFFLPTPKIGELTILLSIILGFMFSKNYFSQKIQIIIIAILVGVGTFTYYFIIILFSYLLN